MKWGNPRRMGQLGVIGAIAGLFAAWIATLLMTPVTLASHTSGLMDTTIDVRDFTMYDRPWGAVGHVLLGALVAGSISLAFVWKRGPAKRLRAALIAIPLGGLMCWCGIAASDIAMIELTKLANGGSTRTSLTAVSGADLISGLMWYGATGLSLTIPVFLATGASKSSFGRAIVGSGLAIALGNVFGRIGLMIAVPVLVAAALATKNPQNIDIAQFVKPIIAAQFFGMGAGAGVAFAVAEAMWKKAWLKGAKGLVEGRKYELKLQVSDVGSYEGSAIYLPNDGHTAAVHAQIHAFEDAHAIYDFGGGMKINGHPVSSAWLMDGDKIEIGTSVLVYRTRSDAPLHVAASREAPKISSPAPASLQPSVVSSYPTYSLTDQFGNQFELVAGSNVIGRDPGHQVSLTWESSVSRRHAEIVIDQQSIMIRDLGSTNGTFVNGHALQSTTPLKPGDQVRLGASTLTIELT